MILYAIYMASTGTVSPNILEALFAQTLVRADRVLTVAVRAANTVAVDAALVDIDAIVVGSVRVTGWTNAVIPASSVLAGLALAALVRSLLTFVYVDAILTRRVQGVTRSADHSGRASARFVNIEFILRRFLPIDDFSRTCKNPEYSHTSACSCCKDSAFSGTRLCPRTCRWSRARSRAGSLARYQASTISAWSSWSSPSLLTCVAAESVYAEYDRNDKSPGCFYIDNQIHSRVCLKCIRHRPRKSPSRR